MNYNSIFLKHENNACLGLEDGRCGLVLLAFLLSEKNEKYKETGLLHLNVTILFSALTRMFPKPTFAP